MLQSDDIESELRDLEVILNNMKDGGFITQQQFLSDKPRLSSREP